MEINNYENKLGLL